MCISSQLISAVILRCSPPSASLEGWPQHRCLRPSFETPRKRAAPQDDGECVEDPLRRFRAGVRRDDSGVSVDSAPSTGSHRQMIHRFVLTLAIALSATPAFAIVGGGGRPRKTSRRAVVTIVGSRGTFCSGA